LLEISIANQAIALCIDARLSDDVSLCAQKNLTKNRNNIFTLTELLKKTY